jgi:hypothetical protein
MRSDGGLLILSRYEIVDAEEMTFFSSEKMQKGILWAKIKLKEDHHLHVFDTHFSSSAPYERYIQRKRQSYAVREFVEMKTVERSKNDLIMINGDLNTDCLSRNFKLSTSYPYNDLSEENAAWLELAHGMCGTVHDIMEGDDKLIDTTVETLGNWTYTLSAPFTNKDGPPYTFGQFMGDGMKPPYKPLYSARQLDYIFILDRNTGKGDLTYKKGSYETEKFFSGNMDTYGYGQLSDHWGNSIKLEVYYNIPLYFYPAVFAILIIHAAIAFVLSKKDKKEPYKEPAQAEEGSFKKSFRDSSVIFHMVHPLEAPTPLKRTLSALWFAVDVVGTMGISAFITMISQDSMAFGQCMIFALVSLVYIFELRKFFLWKCPKTTHRQVMIAPLIALGIAVILLMIFGAISTYYQWWSFMFASAVGVPLKLIIWDMLVYPLFKMAWFKCYTSKKNKSA